MVAIPDTSLPSATRPAPARACRLAAIPALAPILLLAAILRLVRLGDAPFWMDETSTLGFAQLPWSGLFGPLGALETNPPAYYALIKLWIAVAGSSDLALRLPSVAFGLAGVAAIYALTRRCFGPRAAIWAALLMATQAHHLDHSREARVYVLLFLAIALAALAAHRIATWHSGPAPWRATMGLAAATGSAILLHNTGVAAAGCVFLFAGVTALAARRVRPLAFLAAAGLAGLVIGASVLLRVLHQAADGGNAASWIPVPDAVLTTQIALSVLAAPLAGFRDAGPGWVGLMFLLAAGVVALACIRTARHPAAPGLLIALLAAIIGLHIISQHVPVLLERTLLFALVFFIPLLGAALASLRPAARAAALAAIFAAQAPALIQLYAPARHGEDWRALAAAVHHQRQDGQWPLVMLGGFETLALQRYAAPADAAAVSVTPETGAPLATAMTLVLTPTIPLPQNTTAQALCAAIRRAAPPGQPAPGGILLVQRYSALLPAMQPVAEALLAAAGATGPVPPGPTPQDRLVLQRRPGVCAPG